MNKKNINKLVRSVVQEQIKKGNLSELMKETGLSKHWFYEVKKGGIKDPSCSSVEKLFKAVAHPLYDDIQKHIELHDFSDLEAEQQVAA